MPAYSPVTTGQLLDELEDAMNHGSIARRVETLQRVTDLFLIGATKYSNAQTELFDDVFACLVQKIEVSARAVLSARLAPHSAAPPRIVHRLAFDDAISVASPILTSSPRLDDETLMKIAASKGQEHLMAISRRATLSPQVTDVLIDRGNDAVVESTALNKGAAFSDKGFERLVERADGNDDLTLTVGRRPGIPRHHLLVLMARASDAVRASLREEFSAAAAVVKDAVQSATIRIHQQSADSAEVAAAMQLARNLKAENLLDETRIAAFARQDRLEETCATIACLATMSYGEIEAAMVEDRAEGIMVIARVIDFSWANLKCILDMRARLLDQTIADEALSRISYERLRPTTAQQVLRFQRMQRASAIPASPSPQPA